ncbi:hypothetical protein CcCBS67573_g04297 [Chytriomyces confervae]|uniref:Uncharacterized protein n=1 Tax=Chytriomyces confervae TaxID=246404 RepID=A0A507FFC1_9FUNG|nr:hypothetical protein CcCBS67573_g04297 [Chytriomyces confervae]
MLKLCSEPPDAISGLSIVSFCAAPNDPITLRLSHDASQSPALSLSLVHIDIMPPSAGFTVSIGSKEAKQVMSHLCNVPLARPLHLYLSKKKLPTTATANAWIILAFRFDSNSFVAPKGNPQFISENIFMVAKSIVSLDRLSRAFIMDVFAKPFIPDHIKDFNKANAQVIASTPPPTTGFEKYFESWVPASQIHLKPPILPTFSETSETNYQVLNAATHSAHFNHLLGLEHRTRTANMAGFNLYDVQISIRGDIAVLIVPGVTEDSPRLKIGDVLKIRWLSFGHRRTEHLTHVLNVVRRKAEVHFAAEHFRFLSQTLNSFNVQFSFNDLGFRYAKKALASLQPWIDSTRIGNSMLFPEPEDTVGRLGTEIKSEGSFSVQFFDGALNWSQKKAVQAVVSKKYGDVPFLIWGPPGTGKTKTCIECIHQIVVGQPGARILACAPSHSAADTLTRQLRAFLKPGELLRLNASTRPFNEVPDAILAYTFTETDDTSAGKGGKGGEFFSVPPMKALLSTRVVVCTCEDAGILAQCGITNRMIRKTREAFWRSTMSDYGVFCTEVGEEQIQGKLFWSHLFIDEAGQATEPESLIPISVVASEPLVSKKSVDTVQIVLSGDHMQLGPIVNDSNARELGLKKSLFERLIRRPLYRDHPESRCEPRTNELEEGEIEETHGFDGLTESLVIGDVVAPFANLVRNYRSHPSFLMIPSHLYYHNTLIPAASKALTHSLVGSPLLLNPEMPVLFYGIEGKDERILHSNGLNESENSSPGWYNSAEALHVRDIVELLLNEGVSVRDIGVMAPFREQVKLIRVLLRANGCGAVDVGTVEDYQGMERRVIILSTVRSRVSFLEGDLQNDLGIVRKPERLNVAMTRAQALFVGVGNPCLLATDPEWVAFLAFFSRNGCYTGSPLPQNIIQESHSGAAGNYGALERARDSALLLESVPQTKWLGAGVGGDSAGFGSAGGGGGGVMGVGQSEEDLALDWATAWLGGLELE